MEVSDSFRSSDVSVITLFILVWPFSETLQDGNTINSSEENEECVDHSKLCAGWTENLNFCDSDSLYYDFMRTSCRKSCAFCSGAKDDDVSVDQGIDCSYVSCIKECPAGQENIKKEGQCCPDCIDVVNKDCTPIHTPVKIAHARYEGYFCESLTPLYSSSCKGF